MTVAADRALSHGARVTHELIRRSRVHKGGLRRCGRSYLAARLGRTVRQVSRYTSELIAAGHLERVPPRRTWTANGWRTIEVAGYRVVKIAARPHRPRSHRGDIGVPPHPDGCRPITPAGPISEQNDGAAAPAADYAARAAEVRAILAARRAGTSRLGRHR